MIDWGDLDKHIMSYREDFYYGMKKEEIKKETFDVKEKEVEKLAKVVVDKYFNAGTSTIILESGKAVLPGEDIKEPLSDLEIAKFTLNGSLGIKGAS